MNDVSANIVGLFVILAGSRSCVLASVRPEPNIRLCSRNNRLDIEAPIFCSFCTQIICRLARYLCWQIFMRIVNILDLYFQGQIFKSITSESSYMIRLQTVTDTTKTAIANKYKVSYGLRLAYLNLTLAHSNDQGQVQSHLHIDYL